MEKDEILRLFFQTVVPPLTNAGDARRMDMERKSSEYCRAILQHTNRGGRYIYYKRGGVR